MGHPGFGLLLGLCFVRRGTHAALRDGTNWMPATYNGPRVICVLFVYFLIYSVFVIAVEKLEQGNLKDPLSDFPFDVA